MQFLSFDFVTFSASNHKLIQYIVVALIIGLVAVILSRILQKLMKVYFERSSRVLIRHGTSFSGTP